MTKRISRRSFMTAVGAVPAAASLVSGFGDDNRTAAMRPSPSGKLKFGCMATFSDWTTAFGTWGEVGVRYVLNRLWQAGFGRVYWRASMGGGQALYPSRVTNAGYFNQPYDPQKYPEHDLALQKQSFKKQGKPWWGSTFDFAEWWLRGAQTGNRTFANFAEFDPIAIARDYARELGLEFWLWQEQAEDHGGNGVIGRMGLRHPEWFTLNRDGKPSRCRFSFANPLAMEYRAAWVRELLEYEPDGIMFDFTKSMEGTPGLGVTSHFDDHGVWYCGYEKEMVEPFRQKTGRDPFRIPNEDEEWLRFRGSYFTDFVRRLRQMQRSGYPKVKMGLFACPTGRQGLGPSDRYIDLAEPRKSYLEDQDTWTREGLFDEVVNAYATHGLVPGAARIKATVADSRSRVHPPCRYLGTQLEAYTPKDEKTILQSVEAAAESGCEWVVFFESTPFMWNNTWDAVYNAVKRFGADPNRPPKTLARNT